MNPPYTITPYILALVADISERLGEINTAHLSIPPTELRKKNRIKTIQSSLEIEGNTLSIQQITAILNNKTVIAPEKDIIEVNNAIKTYKQLRNFKTQSISDFQKAHKLLMYNLVATPGEFRTTGVGIIKGSEISHLAPPGNMVKPLVNNLFDYLKKNQDIPLIKSCVFHYELEFIHPFVDGNGRMGRLWQTLILMQQHPVFEFLPIETIVKDRQSDYYKALSTSDKSGNSNSFIEFMLAVIKESLERLLSSQNVNLTSEKRIGLFLEHKKAIEFSRQDYLRYYKEISPATASRDLKEAVNNGLLTKFGDKRLTRYKSKHQVD